MNKTLMNKLNKSYNSVKEEIGDSYGGGFAPLPKGKYIGKGISVKVEIRAKTKEEVLNFSVTVSEGDYIGRKVWNSFPLDEDWMSSIVKFFNFCGETNVDFNELDQICEDITSNEDFEYEFAVGYGKEDIDQEYPKAYLNKVLDEGDIQSEGGQGIKEEEGEDDSSSSDADTSGDECPDVEKMSDDELKSHAKRLGMTRGDLKNADDDALMDYIEDNWKPEEKEPEEKEPEQKRTRRSSRAAKPAAKKTATPAAKKSTSAADLKIVKKIYKTFGLSSERGWKLPEYIEDVKTYIFAEGDLEETELTYLKSIGHKKIK